MLYDRYLPHIRSTKWLCLFLGIAMLNDSGTTAQAAEVKIPASIKSLDLLEVNGFFEMRAGSRLQDDPGEKDISVLETRLQVDLFTYTDWMDFKFKGDVLANGVTEDVEGEVREGWLFSRPSDYLDLKLGRQVLTWGTGDLVFLNDLFPKDWQSYFIGRDSEYLKAPSDAMKIGVFSEFANLDLIYTPQFDPDRFITGEYISYWNTSTSQYGGQEDIVNVDQPDIWFEDDEFAVRFYRNINNYELAFYGYWGFWKQPGGQTTCGVSIFPKLNVYGSSLRGQLAGGIGNLELAYYESVEDYDGDNALINNSEIRYVVGYARDLAMDLNASVQYYVEQLLHYDVYVTSLNGDPDRDEFRHLITLQIAKLLMNQNLELSFSGYYSPSDADAYLRPKISYNVTDNILLETGANIFIGNEDTTFFGQFEKNTNIFVATRFSL